MRPSFPPATLPPLSEVKTRASGKLALVTPACDRSQADEAAIPRQMPAAVAGGAVLLGLFFIVESFGPFLMGMGLVSNAQALTLLGLATNGGLASVMLLQWVVGANLVLFASGTGKCFVRPLGPAVPLIALIFLAQVATTLLCAMGWLVEPISWQLIGWVWAYNLAWLVILRGIWSTAEAVVGFLAARQVAKGAGGSSNASSTPAGDRSGRLRPYLIKKTGSVREG